MKTAVIAGVLFLLVLAFLGFNYWYLNRFFEETLALMAVLPEEVEVLETADEKELAEIQESLDGIYGLWKRHETYLCFSLEHTAGRTFLESFLPAMAYFEAREYPAFLAQLRASRDIAEHLVFDESVRLGNVL